MDAGHKQKYMTNPNPSPIGTGIIGFGLSWFGAHGETRTPDLLVRSQSLYPAELHAHNTQY